MISTRAISILTSIVIVGRQIEIVKQVVRHSLSQIATVDLQCEEREAGEGTDAIVELPDNPFLFGGRPFQFRIERRSTLILTALVDVPVELGDLGVREGVVLV